MPNPTDKPLLTLMVCGYNQEKFIREAVEAAFAQTYSPLQIVLSDDSSTDRTFEIMRELAGAYRGPHQVVLNQNATNLGLAGHFNRMVLLARGQLLVGAAGDDISFPNRVETIYQAWEKSDRKAIGIQSGFVTIDEEGALIDGSVDCAATEKLHFSEGKPGLENYVRTLKPGILGASFAVSASVFSTFGPLPETLIHEDSVIGLRVLCMGSLTFINIPLVKRRIHANNLYSRDRNELASTRGAVTRQETRAMRDAENRVTMYDVFLLDLNVALNQGLISLEQWHVLKNICVWRRRVHAYQAEFPTANMARKLSILFAASRDRVERPILNWMIPRLMPQAGFCSLKVAGNSIRGALKSGFRAKSD
ncbi:MAG: glycosyltransferase [Verrucomicrobiota bacterium]|jgi:glycosyltransferase involved in cell wall biosynthesis